VRGWVRLIATGAAAFLAVAAIATGVATCTAPSPAGAMAQCDRSDAASAFVCRNTWFVFLRSSYR
jgi:hypothetical protein